MKQNITKLASYLLMVLFALTLNSCKDDEIAHTLDGIWEGEVATEFFNYRFGGVQTEYQAVDIQFYADPYKYAKGTGVEYDYYGNSYSMTKVCFNFEVKNEVIYLDYNDGSHIAIYNYRLTDTHFSGEFVNYNTREYLASFNLVKVTDWRHDRYPRSGEQLFKEVPNPLQKPK